MSRQSPVLDADLHAYVDGEADAALRQRVQAYLASSNEAARRVAGWSMQGEALREAFPLPRSVRLPLSQPQAQSPSKFKSAVYGLTLLLAFAAGVAAAVMAYITFIARI